MNTLRHPLVERMAQAQEAREGISAAAQPINAQAAFIRQRVLADSHRRGRAVLAWATEHGHQRSPCMLRLAAAIAAGEPIAPILMDCWTDFPATQVVS